MKKKGDYSEVIDIRIDDTGKIPAKYWLHPDVLESVRRVVRDDVVLNKRRVPPGCAPLWGAPAGTMQGDIDRLRASVDNFWRHFRRDLPAFMVAWFISMVFMALLILFLSRGGQWPW